MILPSNDFDALAKTWDEKPDVIRAFIEIRPQYEHLFNEVAYILKKRMDESGIEYAAVTGRAKSLKSFAEKIARKKYVDPLKDITDLAGVRLVYLYKSDRPAIEKIIEPEFDIIERVDKVEEQEVDRFGYGALHYLVHLGLKSSGARYDDLKGLVCEIQVRTVLQDAWAIIDHHLSYKQESDIPKILRRKINSLSGLFETADDQFNQVRIEREGYVESVKGKLNNESSFLQQEINLDTFSEFLKWKFPQKEVAGSNNHLSLILSDAVNYKYKNLSELNDLLKRTERAREAINNDERLLYAASELAAAIALAHPDNRDELWEEEFIPLFNKYEHLIET